MQKSKTKQIYNIYKRYYTCSNGHSLVWKGGVYIFTNTPCFKCKKNYTENNIYYINNTYFIFNVYQSSKMSGISCEFSLQLGQIV